MRVALISHNARAGDAIGNLVAEKLTFFLDRGADIRVFVGCDQRLHPSVQPYSLRLADAEPAGEAWAFLTSADLVIFEYGQYYDLLGLMPALVGAKPRVLLDYHGVTPPGLWGSHNREAIEKGIRHRGLAWCADAVVAHSRFAAEELIAAASLPGERLTILHHPIEPASVTTGPCRRIRGELGLGDAKIVLFVGRLAPNKRVPLLIEALDRLRDHSPAIHLVIVGDNTDLYQDEARRCRERAQELGLSDRVHILGQVSAQRLQDAYHAADVFVMPSLHEGFCIPVLEAMAYGVPVVAARAAALPETVGDGGLTFESENADDLARQICRVVRDPNAALTSRRKPSLSHPIVGQKDTGQGGDSTLAAPSLRVAVVAFRFGSDFVGGAEHSMRQIALSLHQAGHAVEVFTTCTRSESQWKNELREGTTTLDGLVVHRFPLDPHHRSAHLESVRAILESGGDVSPEVEQQYVRHSIHSSRLIDALRERAAEFDAILAGPYLFGLTHDVAMAFPEKTLLVPCFHVEPIARLRCWLQAYEPVGGILYHSPEEKDGAEVRMGLNHPGAFCVGTLLAPWQEANPERARKRAKLSGRYVVYCGRYSQQKNLPLLIDYARRYQESRPGRFTFVFMGQGEVAIPRERWARDLGFIDEAGKYDVLAGASAVVQLSQQESLSLVSLEAWSQEVPVVASKDCAVMQGHLTRSDGGRAVDGFDSFAAALDDLWRRPEEWQAMGRRGRAYVQSNFMENQKYVQVLTGAVLDLSEPWANRMRRRGLRRAADFARPRWRQQFGRLVEGLLDASVLDYREEVVVRPRGGTRTISQGLDSVLVPVFVANHGTHAVAAEGPARMVLRSFVLNEQGRACLVRGQETPLPEVLVPGHEFSAAVRVWLPGTPGVYRVGFYADHARARSEDPIEAATRCFPEESWLRLVVDPAGEQRDAGCLAPGLGAVDAALAQAEQRQRLPDNYTDVTEGFLAGWKLRLKRKLLGNFKHAYVDVLSRQQSAFNHHVVTALQELAECCATLDHARDATVQPSKVAEGCVDRASSDLLRQLLDRLAAAEDKAAILEERLNRMEEAATELGSPSAPASLAGSGERS